MVQVQVDLNKEQNKRVEIHKAKHGLPSKEAAIKDMIDKGVFDVN